MINTNTSRNGVELFIETESRYLNMNGNEMNDAATRTNGSNGPEESLESSMSTYDSMMQTLTEELNAADYNHDNHNSHNSHELDLDFEDLDFFKMDCATALSFDYEMNYTMKQLKHIAGYYGIKQKSKKGEIIQDIVAYETDSTNFAMVGQRRRMFHYIDALKNDEYLKSYVMI